MVAIIRDQITDLENGIEPAVAAATLAQAANTLDIYHDCAVPRPIGLGQRHYQKDTLMMHDLHARDLQPGDVTDLFHGQAVTVARIDQVRPGFVRVVACVGYRLTDTPDLSLIVPATASALVTRRAVAA